MAENKLVGQDYTTPDLRAKVTGRSKYAEDFRAEGMLFTKLLLSPFPHARVKSIADLIPRPGHLVGREDRSHAGHRERSSRPTRCPGRGIRSAMPARSSRPT